MSNLSDVISTEAEMDYAIARVTERLTEKRRSSLLSFTRATMPTFAPADFHRHYYNILTRFAMGEYTKLMVFMPPQHGKSEGSTRRLPAFLLGRNPDTKVAVVSYSAPKARKFNREIQRIIDTPEYRAIFPETTLNGKNITAFAGPGLRNADECEIVGHRGGFKTVGVGGPLTGEPVDVLIMDDIYKDAKSAWSATVRESISDWYDTVAETRLHNNSKQLIVFTRWHEDDLAGQLLAKQGTYDPDTNPTGWVVASFPAIKIGEPNEFDKRNDGEPLWPERHSLDKLNQIRERNPHVFESLYQQDPKPVEGLLYEQDWHLYDIIPPQRTSTIKCYIDTADTGADYLCAIVYNETPTGNYILDVLYTQRAMEFTETATMDMLNKYCVDVCNIESNNGGRSFARNVEKMLRESGNTHTRIKWFAQTLNKASRIFTQSADVQNMTYWPTTWQRMWPKFAAAICGYMKTGRNEHDDAVDALTGTIEMRKQPAGNAAGYFF